MLNLPSPVRAVALLLALGALWSPPAVAEPEPPPADKSKPQVTEPKAKVGASDAEVTDAEVPDSQDKTASPEPERDAGAGETEMRDTPNGAPSDAAPVATESAPVPPELKQGATPVFPETALREGVTQASVTLKVRVGIDGKVEVLGVVEAAGHGFDEAAKEAAIHYLFYPATVSGQAVPALILLRVDFEAPTPAAPPVAASGEALVTPTPTGVHPVPQPPQVAETPVEVTVQGQSEADRLRRSAEAVNVLETREAKRHTQDLGEVLARTQGVAVQRFSGLGSDTRVSLNGLTDDQIRFFLDGIPLEFAGYQLGIANVPVNLVNRIEVYRGVVPVRFGADALGGAINLVSEDRMEEGAHGAASFQTGSFGTYRTTGSGQYLDAQRGWFTRVAAFLDLADNDYPMNVPVPDASGQDVETRVYRFHDGYRALGANAEVGVIDKPWAKRFSLKGFVSDYDKDVQHNLMMKFSPYGDVTYGLLSGGGTANYEQVFAKQVLLEVVAGYAYRHTSYVDVGECLYNWFGQCVDTRAQPGETIGLAQDQDYWEHNFYGRVNAEWRAHPSHALHLSASPTYTSRTGKENRLANPDARDPLSADRRIGGLVSGLEYQLDVLDGDLENRLFVKDYLQLLRSEDPLSNGVDFRREDRTIHRVGLGDGLRYTWLEWLYSKASYEWATRLPRADEVFGNAFPVQPNLQLDPETSHNVNLGVTVDSLHTSAGEWRAEVNGFVREIHNLIRLIGDDKKASYQNVRDARSLGAETALGWTSPGKYVSIDGNATYVDFRNTSKDGTDARYEGDRIAYRPYFFATGNVRLQASEVATARDELSINWTSRYVHSFFLGWESAGTGKSVVPKQLLHSLALTYAVDGDPLDLSFSSEVQNVTDAEAYDFFGVPKPGRAFYFKMTTSL
jgi:vitamin B12 transporter